MALTWLPSAWPRTWGIMRPITLPRSAGPAAPVSAMACWARAVRAASSSWAGRYSCSTARDASSFATRSGRPPSPNIWMLSRRSLACLATTSVTPASSSTFWLFFSVSWIWLLRNRRVSRRSWLRARIALRMSSSSRSLMVVVVAIGAPPLVPGSNRLLELGRRAVPPAIGLYATTPPAMAQPPGGRIAKPGIAGGFLL